MPGIMNEGSAAGSDPKCGARKGSQSVPRGAWGQLLPAVESLHWPETEDGKGPFCFAGSFGRVGGVG